MRETDNFLVEYLDNFGVDFGEYCIEILVVLRMSSLSPLR